MSGQGTGPPKIPRDIVNELSPEQYDDLNRMMFRYYRYGNQPPEDECKEEVYIALSKTFLILGAVAGALALSTQILYSDGKTLLKIVAGISTIAFEAISGLFWISS